MIIIDDKLSLVIIYSGTSHNVNFKELKTKANQNCSDL